MAAIHSLHAGNVIVVQLGLYSMTVVSCRRLIRPSLSATGVCPLQNVQATLLASYVTKHHTKPGHISSRTPQPHPPPFPSGYQESKPGKERKKKVADLFSLLPNVEMSN